jgi:hypothetical protein
LLGVVSQRRKEKVSTFFATLPNIEAAKRLMLTQLHSGIKAHLIRGAFYLLLLFAVCVIPPALAQRNTGNSSTSENAMQLPKTANRNLSTTAAGAVEMPEIPTDGVLYNQYDNPATKPPLGIGSQEFEPAMAAFNDQAADDFVFTYPFNNVITGVRVMGEYSEGGGPALSFNVYIYQNGPGNLPGALIAARFNRPYTGTPPDFAINLISLVTLGPGTYWISVQARQDFNPNGQWFWHNRTVQSNAGAAWQNPGNGYGTGCTIWNRKNACMPGQVWPDQVFQIIGFLEGPPPTPTPTPMQRVSATPRPRPSAAPRP